MLKSVTSIVLTQQIKYLSTLECLHPPTNQDNWITVIPIWKKRGSRYLRYALYNATKYVCHWDESFGIYLAKKRAEGKHYNVALPDRQNDMW